MLEISTDPAAVDLDWLHHRLSTDAYWAPGRSRERVRRVVENSLPYSVFHDGSQIAFARLVTDRTTFAWLSDVYVDRWQRGKGVGKLLLDRIMADADDWGLRRMALATGDAHDMYRPYGFTAHPEPDQWMEKTWPADPA
ncbi:GNAT family N-acetyltransferase [Nocardia sp. NPDC056541]|uniref:GNAT family N-acetyltransferase n=1 Tax=Nocardia sp. NPDC056541 TaxID=3345860 RepID=UPI003672C1D9